MIVRSIFDRFIADISGLLLLLHILDIVLRIKIMNDSVKFFRADIYSTVFTCYLQFALET